MHDRSSKSLPLNDLRRFAVNPCIVRSYVLYFGMAKKTNKKPGKKRDVNEMAALIVDQATAPSEGEEQSAAKKKNAAAVELGRLGGLKGGKARALKLTAEERTRIAEKAARARWQKDS